MSGPGKFATKLNIVCSSYDLKTLNTFLRLLPTDPKLGRRGQFFRLPTQIKRWTVNRGPFVHGKAKETLERRTHRALVPIEGPLGLSLRWVAAMRDAGTQSGISFKFDLRGTGEGGEVLPPKVTKSQERRRRDKS